MTAPPRLVILGLGPGDPSLRTLGAQAALRDADRIILRTRVHPGLADLADDPRVSDCDDLYTAAADFDQLYAAIAERVITHTLSGGMTVFAVPGHPRFAERTVGTVEKRSAAAGIPIEVVDGVSFLDVALSAIGDDAVAKGLQIVDAEHLATVVDREPYAAGLLGVDPARPAIVAQLYNADLAAVVKLALTRLYPDEHRVTVIRGAGLADGLHQSECALHELDRQPVDHLTALWVPALAALDAVRTPEALARIVARLRAPGGCPWDREQTHASLRNAIIEEAYEAVDAIDADDAAGLAEELGDLLLLVMMQAQIAEEAGAFRIDDVYEGISRKLIRRHPHVFGDVLATTPDAVIATWESVKSAERARKSNGAKKSRFERLPRAMPATRKAVELLAPRSALAPPSDEGAGDALLAELQNLLHAGIDPDLALEASLRRASDDQRSNATQVDRVGAASGKGDA